MKCLECGAINIKLREYCHKCGADLQPAKDLKESVYNLELNISDVIILKNSLLFSMFKQKNDKDIAKREDYLFKKLSKLKNRRSN